MRLTLLAESMSLMNEASFPRSVATGMFEEPSIKQQLAELGVRERPRFFAEGGYGFVYNAGTIAVKVTPHQQEANIIRRIVEQRRQHPNLVNYYGVIDAGTFKDSRFGLRPFYMIVMDFVPNVGRLAPPALRQAAAAVGGFLEADEIRPPFDTAVIYPDLLTYAEGDLDQVGRDYALSLLGIINDIFDKTKVWFKDLNENNVGLDADQEIKLFDLGLSEISA